MMKVSFPLLIKRCVCVCVYMCVCLCVYMCVCVYVCVHVYMFVCVYVCVCVHVYMFVLVSACICTGFFFSFEVYFVSAPEKSDVAQSLRACPYPRLFCGGLLATNEITLVDNEM